MMTRQYAIAYRNGDLASGTRYRDLEMAEWALAEVYSSSPHYCIVFQDFTDWKRVEA